MNKKFDDWNNVKSLREFQALRDLSEGCRHLCHIYDIMREQDGSLHFAFELMPDGSLNDFIRSYKSRGERIGHLLIESVLWQVLKGLEHIHSKGYMHRDIKPENLLMRGNTCKVADFSLARETGGTSCGKKMTSYVSTRWYRAPEIILCAPRYSSAIDMFALGCVMAEMYRLEPLLPGTGEIAQLHLILDLWGPTKLKTWTEGAGLAQRIGIEIPQSSSTHGRSKVAELVPATDEIAIALLENLLLLNPAERLTAMAALDHDYFAKSALLQMEERKNSSIISTTPSIKTPPNTKRDVYEDLQLPPVVSIEKENEYINYLAGNMQEPTTFCYDGSQNDKLLGSPPNKKRRSDNYNPSSAFTVWHRTSNHCSQWQR